MGRGSGRGEGGRDERDEAGAVDPRMKPADTLVDGRAGITAGLVRRLIAAQFPQWAGLDVSPVEVDGWDNRTYRLGEQLSVRLPTAAGYVPAVAKEHRWLSRLAPALPLPIPTSVAVGEPGEGYPHPWSVRTWLDGAPARPYLVPELTQFAADLADFLRALWSADASDGPGVGAHSFHRGGPPAHYDAETRRCLAALNGVVDTEAAARVWDAALESRWTGAPVWFHGDIAANNLLVRDGRLAAVIDFGTSGTGDPACDLVVAWTFFTGPSRAAFKEAVAMDPAAWARARGWALWKALLVISETDRRDPVRRDHLRVIADVLNESPAA
jgi:aminoglycoside phosphotransferase (APT) family kinase protein